jgi:hypothetical protein
MVSLHEAEKGDGLRLSIGCPPNKTGLNSAKSGDDVNVDVDENG